MLKQIKTLSLVFGAIFLFASCSEMNDRASETDKLNPESKARQHFDSILKSFERENIPYVLPEESHSLELRTFCEGEFSVGQECFEVSVIAEHIDVPSRPGGLCPGCDDVIISYDMDICFDLDPLTFEITNINVFFSDLDVQPSDSCTDFWDCFNDLSDTEKDEVLDQMEYDASLIEEERQMTLVVDQFNVPCVPFSGRVVASTFIRQNCYQRCFVYLHEWPFWDIQKISCGDQCCLRTRTWCRNFSGVLIYTGPEFQLAGSECGDAPLDFTCKKVVSGCAAVCGEL